MVRITRAREVDQRRSASRKLRPGPPVFVGAYMTVCRIQRNNAEERIRAVLEGRKTPMSATSTGEVPEEGEVVLQDLATLAMDQIRTWITEHFHGHDLARLVDGVLRAQGYRTELSPPGPDGGVDIMAGQGPMGFESPGFWSR